MRRYVDLSETRADSELSGSDAACAIETPLATRTESASQGEWLVGGGEMAKMIKAMDWSKTPLGPMAGWPQSLRTTVSLVQASSSPISLSWGSGHVLIYNDGYWPICGPKHPTSMGQDLRECWASAFPVIGAAYAMAWSGKSTYLEEMRMFLDRAGFLEETWFTFSFSPITDESGGIGGVFNPVTDMTRQMLSGRRTRTLRELATRAADKAKTTEEAFVLSTRVLAESELDLPFFLLYRVDGAGKRARLVGQSGLAMGCAAAPDFVDLQAAGECFWSIAEVARTGLPRQRDDVASHLAGTRAGPYPENPKTVLTLPILQAGSEIPSAILVGGVSSRLTLNESYRAFYDLIAAGVGAALANARACESELNKALALAAIERANEELEQFAEVASHDLKEPLRMIRIYVELLEREYKGRLDADADEYIHYAVDGAKRMQSRIDDLRALSRLHSQAKPLCPTESGAVLEVALGDLEEAIAQSGAVVTHELLPVVMADGGQLRLVFQNLIANAIKFRRPEAALRVDVLAEREGTFWTFLVRDNGIGIAAKHVQRIFRIFQRLHSGDAYPGSGLGLAICKKVVERAGGRIWVDSVPGTGSTFGFTLLAPWDGATELGGNP